jgi:hypothetical protein
VLDATGVPAAGVAVTVRWSGLVTGDVIGTTNSAGQVTIRSRQSKKRGTVTGTVIAVAPATGSTYDPSIYPESLTRSVVLN